MGGNSHVIFLDVKPSHEQLSSRLFASIPKLSVVDFITGPFERSSVTGIVSVGFVSQQSLSNSVVKFKKSLKFSWFWSVVNIG